MGTDARATLTEGERSFVEKIAQYYHANDGMPHDRGRVVGYLMICDPPTQTADQISAAIGAPRAAIDRIAEQLTPENDPVVVFERIGALTGDYTLRMRENSWAPKVQGIFSEWADFHGIVAEGLDSLKDAPSERTRRLSNLERFLRYLSVEMPEVLRRHEERMSAGRPTLLTAAEGGSQRDAAAGGGGPRRDS